MAPGFHRLARDEAGIGLVDVIMAGSILMLAVVVIPATMNTASNVNVNATTKVVATGIARQYLSSWTQQLQADTVADFPSPFLECRADGSGSTQPVCQPQGSRSSAPAARYATCATPTVSQPNCTDVSPTDNAPSPIGGQVSLPAGVFREGNPQASVPDFTVTSTAEWVCQESSATSAGSGGQTSSGSNLQAPSATATGVLVPAGVAYNQGINGNAIPEFEVQVTVAWKDMTGGVGVTLYMTVPPPPGISTQIPPPNPDLGISNTGNTPPCT